jgi:hypothetical protein
MRLLRVTHLYETGVWTDGTLPRSNWPYGESQNWTRPSQVRRTAIEGDLRQALYTSRRVLVPVSSA